jgi:outer membrane protein assembly factor BamE
MPRYQFPLVAIFCTLLAACTYKPAFINEYKIDVQQGNVLTQEMVNQLKPGQTRDQVRFILGSPIITDIFHQQRWDYVYRYQNGQTGGVEARQLVVFFDAGGRLERVAGDVASATPGELAAPQASSRLLDLGTLSGDAADQPLPPREVPSYYRRFRDMIGF